MDSKVCFPIHTFQLAKGFEMQIFRYCFVPLLFLAGACGEKVADLSEVKTEQVIDKKQAAALKAIKEYEDYLKSDQYKIDQEKKRARVEAQRQRMREFMEYDPAQTKKSQGTE
ncbi:hypothetical protein [Limnobacter sp.]|uniref:hypothetical protein n=1 Tax=Limnobacter sp. TaxID=2003368 RepID=UPI00374A0760